MRRVVLPREAEKCLLDGQNTGDHPDCNSNYFKCSEDILRSEMRVGDVLFGVDISVLIYLTY